MLVEVEDSAGITTGISLRASKSGYSGSGYVEISDNSAFHMTVEIPASQYYKITVRHTAGAHKENSIMFNGLKVMDVVSENGDWQETVVNGIFLEKGLNEVTLGPGWSWFALDSRIMYDRYTNHHKLNNLIWVWNSPVPECYPGDDVVDIISRDMYPPAHMHTSQVEMYNDLIKITDEPKIVLIGETGTLPDPLKVIEDRAGWASYMTWSHVFCLTEEFNTNDALKQVYNSPYAITKDTLPELY